MITPVDRVQCKLFYCPCCAEIYHDRNYPINLKGCLHMLCQHCVKTQLLSGRDQVSSNNNQTVYKVQCVLCENRIEYDDIYLLEFENTVNFELVALIYKQRGEIVAKAPTLYERPDEDAEIDIFAITRVGDNRMINIVKKREEEKFIQGMISQNPTRK